MGTTIVVTTVMNLPISVPKFHAKTLTSNVRTIDAFQEDGTAIMM
jgi:uncharacterized protein (UPF0261 family)